jgi:HEAT repeat protein
MIGRLLAVDEIAKRKDPKSVNQLKGVLNDDPFYGVRVAAAGALRSMQTDEAYEALAASLKQKDARVRVAVVRGIGGFYRVPAFELSEKILETEKNPDIIAAALANLGASHQKGTEELLIRFLNTDSFHNTIGLAALGAMRAQDNPVYITPILTYLRQGDSKFTSRGFGSGLETLAYLGREQEKKDAIREFLLENVNSKRKPIQLAAIAALGTLGDARAVAAVETFTSAPKESRERAVAEKTLVALRDTRKTAVELGNLRSEVLSLQKENRDLRKQFDDFKKRLDATLPLLPTLAKTNKPAASPRGSK